MGNVFAAADFGSMTDGWGNRYCFDPSFRPYFLLEDGSFLYFEEAERCEAKEVVRGTGIGFSLTFSGFESYPALNFELRMLTDDASHCVDVSFVPLCMDEVPVKEVCFPGPLVCDGKESYAVLTTMQGQLLPSEYPEAFGEKLPFNGQMCSETAYMPWFGEICPTGGYLCYVRNAADAALSINHPAGGPNRINVRHLVSLGRVGYARTVSYYFVPTGSSYVDLAKLYRSIADEEGRPVTLREKAVRNPKVKDLVGCCVLHVPGKTHVSPDSRYYDKEHPEKNDRLVPFSVWEERVRRMKDMGVSQLYLHLDGWGQPGYDNHHPDYLPACSAAGGWNGLKSLQDKLHSCGYLFGLHDQYRDYYLDAPTYDRDEAIQAPDGSVYEQTIWAGGRQNFLCAERAFSYVKRNFSALFSHDIHPDCTYLDVFTCNEPDECANPHHPMTRQQSLEDRGRCFSYLTAHGIVPSSEEVNDWAVGTQVFCHWAPYMDGSAIPVPLYNLVYHDCVMIPWMTGTNTWGIPSGTTGFLHALLNGGMGYLSETAEGDALEKNIREVEVLSRLQHHVAFEPLENHHILDQGVQESVFGDGTVVRADFNTGSWEILYPDKTMESGTV